MRRENWSNLYGNQFNQNISWTMLTEPYHVKKGKHYFLREPKPLKHLVEESEVIYDRDYVVEYIARKVISPLQPDSYNELQKILSDAWHFYKNLL